MEVEGVLCFKDRQVLDLSDGNGRPAQWTVILGDNGVGKTTLLRCLAGMECKFKKDSESNEEDKKELAYPLLFSPSENILTWQSYRDIKQNSKILAFISIDINLTSLEESGIVSNAIQHSWQTDSLEIRPSFSYIQESSDDERLRGLVCYGYGATRKIGEASISESLNHENSASLFSEKIALINAEEWLLQTNYATLLASGEMRDRFQNQFDRIVEILKSILPDVEDIRIAPTDLEIPRPRAEFLTPYGWVRLSSLGLGYRTMIAWMVDLAVRLFQRYPDSEDPLAEPAIVLVDEIDLHLHPRWQRNIMSFLTERFPNTQFIVTAHSPLVVQAAKNANIVLLRREGDRVIIDNNPEIIENWRVDQVLTSVFELPTARPANLDPLLNRRQELLSKSRLSKADKAELKELEAKIGSFPTAETPDDIKAMDIIRRAAKLLENSGTGELGDSDS
ncbi:AAA family ATPase [Desertifilum sp. FACHB-866]|uniref:ATPase AAA-type core domain-containing protein n=1 Tax=Desertifilum tharense IPPAS B-1220 TaxID=1781255 RepID=A0A1E5QMN7_9CYAN|nr:AAA family ATPase [Desertifilum sp. FACHB-866]MBD2334418.1 AAA family ATPase [Desertifilum sp. FACHB-868]OEJ75854.1 hypothetical protein BH720_07040 [Desertifilum tharense IPPAS B-1220]